MWRLLRHRLNRMVEIKQLIIFIKKNLPVKSQKSFMMYLQFKFFLFKSLIYYSVYNLFSMLFIIKKLDNFDVFKVLNNSSYYRAVIRSSSPPRLPCTGSIFAPARRLCAHRAPRTMILRFFGHFLVHYRNFFFKNY